MSKKYVSRYDTEKSWLVHGADYDEFDIPIIRTANVLPTALQSFSHRDRALNFERHIHFYEPDIDFVQLKNNPKVYVEKLRQFDGIISPDFSICPDYPYPRQLDNKYWNHALAYWLSTQGIPVIPNVRWGDERSYGFCFSGIEENSVVAIGTHGQMRAIVNRELFIKGLAKMVLKLTPHTIIVYGKAPADIFGKYEAAGIKIIHFPSETEQYYKKYRKVVA